MVNQSSCLPLHITQDKTTIFKAMQLLNYCSTTKTLPIINWTHTCNSRCKCTRAVQTWELCCCQPAVPTCWWSTEQILLVLLQGNKMCLSQEIVEPPATLNASAHEQCKPESSAVVNLLCQPADNLHHRYCWCYCKEIKCVCHKKSKNKAELGCG